MNLNFNEICRLCLRFCEGYVDLNQTNRFKTLSKELTEKIKFCYFIQIDLSDGLPTKICYECIQVVSFFYLAKKNVTNAQKFLKNVLSVRKKMQDNQIYREENVTSDLIDISKVKQKNRASVLATPNKAKDFDQDVASSCHAGSNCNKKSVDEDESSCTSVDLKKSNSVSNEILVINLEADNDFEFEKIKEQEPVKSNNQKSDLGQFLNDPYNELVLSLKFKELNEFRNQCKINSEMRKG